MYVSDNFCYRSFLLQSIFNSLVDIQLKWLNLLCWAYPQLIFLKLTESKICGWQTMTNIKRWQLANCKWCKLAPTITVLCTCSFACTKVRAEPFHVHENQCTQILNLSSPVTWNIFLEKSKTKYDGETIPRLFSKKSKLSISMDQQSKDLHIFFNCMPSWGLYKYIQTKLLATCIYLKKIS